MQFSDIPGSSFIKNTLLAAVDKKHVAHAQLFVGREGGPNLAFALAYAKFINCEDPQPTDSCGRCSSCIQFKKVVHPDLHLVFPMASIEKVEKSELKSYLLKEFRSFILQNPYSDIHDWGHFIGAENKQFSIPVDEGRSLMQAIAMKSFQAEYKIVIIWLPELMHITTANAILKVLEEPPVKTLFFMVCNDVEKLLPTIISRCQILQIPQFEDQDIENQLINIYDCDAQKAKKIAFIADGSLNKAIKLTQENLESSQNTFATWMRLCYGKKYAEMLTFAEDLSKIGRENQKNVLLHGLEKLRGCMLHTQGATKLIRQSPEDIAFIENFSKILNIHIIVRITEILTDTHLFIERNGNSKIILFEASLLVSLAFNFK